MKKSEYKKEVEELKKNNKWLVNRVLTLEYRYIDLPKLIELIPEGEKRKIDGVNKKTIAESLSYLSDGKINDKFLLDQIYCGNISISKKEKDFYDKAIKAKLIERIMYVNRNMIQLFNSQEEFKKGLESMTNKALYEKCVFYIEHGSSIFDNGISLCQKQ